jgi:hypothetical protein
MPDKEIVEWFKQQLKEGFSRDEVVEMLKEMDYSEKDVKEIVQKATGAKPKTQKQVKPEEAVKPIDDEVVDWYRQMLRKGFSKQKLEKDLKKTGYLPEQVEVIAELAGAEEAVEQEQAEPSVVYEEDYEEEEPSQFSDFVSQAKDGFSSLVDSITGLFKSKKRKKKGKSQPGGFPWSLLVVLFLFFVLLLITAFLICFLWPGGNCLGIGNGNDTNGYTGPDEAPPEVVLVGVPQEWQASTATVSVRCTDNGKDASGCDPGTYRLLKGEFPCPQDYSKYKMDSPKEFNIGGSVCGAAKDKAGNVAFTEAMELKVDQLRPKTVFTTPAKDSLQDKDFYVSISDTDPGGSGVSKCYYQVVSFDGSSWKVTKDWWPRDCNSPVLVLVTECASGGGGACAVKAYAVDLVNNKGLEVNRTFKVAPSAPQKALYLTGGTNYVSLVSDEPLLVSEVEKACKKTDPQSAVFVYTFSPSGSVVSLSPPENMRPGNGYVVMVAGPDEGCVVELEGDYMGVAELQVQPGKKYFIGGPGENTVQVASVMGSCPQGSLDVFQAVYDKQAKEMLYLQTDVLEPGKAYWLMNVKQSCTFGGAG